RRVLALPFAAALLLPLPAGAQIVRQDFYVTNGPVHAEALSGNTLYLGGAFHQIGPSTGGGVPIDSASALPVPSFPRVTASGTPAVVDAAISDGAGGWFI